MDISRLSGMRYLLREDGIVPLPQRADWHRFISKKAEPLLPWSRRILEHIRSEKSLKKHAEGAECIEIVLEAGGFCRLYFYRGKTGVTSFSFQEPSLAEVYVEGKRKWAAKTIQEAWKQSIPAVRKSHPRHVLYQRWAYMRTTIYGLLKDPSLSLETKNALRFFLLQYLAKIASHSFDPESENFVSLTPMQTDVMYHRSTNDIPILQMLEAALLVKLGIRASAYLSLPDFAGVEEIIPYPYRVCKLEWEDDDTTVLSKLSESEGDLAVYFHATIDPAGDIRQQRENIEKRSSDFAKHFPTEKKVMIFAAVTLGTLSFILIPTITLPGFHQYSNEPYEELRTIQAETGSIPTQQQAARTLAAMIENIEGFAAFSHAPPKAQEHLGTLFIPTFNAFVTSSTYLRFKNIALQPLAGYPRALPLLAENICRFIEGLREYEPDRVFERLRLSGFLRESYARVLNFMEVLLNLDYENTPLACYFLDDYKDLIFEDLFFWAELCLDLSRAAEGLSSGAMVEEGPAVFGLVSSGMRCSALIRRTLKKLCPSREVELVMFEDTYFENFLPHNRETITLVTSTRLVSTYDDSLRKCIMQFQGEEKRIDALFIDFHSSVNTNCAFLTAHDVGSVIREVLFQRREPLMVVIDATLGMIRDDEVHNLLRQYREEVLQGRLSIALYRSCQKYDQFGTDKLSGGFIQLFSSDRETVRLFREELEKEHVDGYNIKALSHLYRHCSRGLDLHRKMSFDSARLFYESLGKEAFYEEGSIGFEVKNDPRNPFNVLIMPYDRVDALQPEITKLFYKNKMAAIPRISFGFVNTTISLFDALETADVLARVSFGLEEPEHIRGLAKDLTAWIANFKSHNM